MKSRVSCFSLPLKSHSNESTHYSLIGKTSSSGVATGGWGWYPLPLR